MTDPTMFGMVGGEAGPEAILPLDTFWTQLHDAFENVLGFQSMQSGVPGMGSRASEVYDQITNNETINNNSTQNSSEDKIHFTYAPNVTIQGNASREDVEEALSMSQDEFNRMFDEYVRQKGRTAFA